MPDRAAWEKLGGLLRARRVDGLGYGKLAKFSRDRGIGERTAWNLENASRDSYAPGTLLLADKAYGLAPGSCSGFLDGGELAEIPDSGLLDDLSEDDREDIRRYVELVRLRAERRKRQGC